MQYDLSLIFPSRSEMFLSGTIEKALERTGDKTEIIVVLDGEWAEPPIVQHERVNVIYVPESIGQRAATNLGVKLSKAKYVCKLDAHVLLDKNFDVKMLDAFRKAGDNVTMVSIMRNLHMFDWKCYKCGWKKYQGPTPEKCEQCGERHHLKRKIIWKGKERPQSTSYCFDSTPHFQYFRDYTKRPEYQEALKTDLTETMSLQGSCFMLTREKYWELNICDELVGSWGNQGIETACKTWLSGGRVLVNHNTWYAHMFRTQGGDFVPNYLRERGIAETKEKIWNLIIEKKLTNQKYPVSWLIKKFWPVPGWTEEDLKKLDGIQ